MRIRPLERGDLLQVAEGYQRLVRLSTFPAPSGLVDAMRRLFLDAPVASPDIPSLVVEGDDGVAGFLGVQTRIVSLEGELKRLASFGPMFVAPDLQKRGVGVFLLRKALQGPQDLSTSDGANDKVRQVWERLGGRTAVAQSLEWATPLRPALLELSELTQRGGRVVRLASRLLKPVALGMDRIAQRRWQDPFVRAADKAGDILPLTADRLAFLSVTIDPGTRLRPVYDTRTATWLLDELRAFDCRGELIASAVEHHGKPVGWFLGFLGQDRKLKVIQVHSAAGETARVLATLICTALERDAVAVSGRIDGRLALEVKAYRGRYRYGTWTLAHGHQALIDAFLSLDAAVSRAEGEWWMALHMQPY